MCATATSPRRSPGRWRGSWRDGIAWAAHRRASTSPCMRTSLAGRMARSRCSTRLRWCAGRAIAGSPIMRGSRSCRRDDMARFVIAPHMRLHEWVAEEKGYFADAGLDYEFRDELRSPTGRRHDLGDRVGAYQTIEKGRTSDVSCACHWTV